MVVVGASRDFATPSGARVMSGPVAGPAGGLVGEEGLGMSETTEASARVAAVMPIRLSGREWWYVVLWTDNDCEDFAYRHGSASPLYRDRDALAADLDSDGIPVDDEVGWRVDVDHAREVLGFTMSRDEIEVVINAWNSLDDLTKSLGVPLGFRGTLANRAYDKLFWGLNLPSVTPPGKWFTPGWWPGELGKIDQVLRECGARVLSSAEPQSIERRRPHRTN